VSVVEVLSRFVCSCNKSYHSGPDTDSDFFNYIKHLFNGACFFINQMDLHYDEHLVRSEMCFNASTDSFEVSLYYRDDNRYRVVLDTFT
jgi:hypothetical protein